MNSKWIAVMVFASNWAVLPAQAQDVFSAASAAAKLTGDAASLKDKIWKEKEQVPLDAARLDVVRQAIMSRLSVARPGGAIYNMDGTPAAQAAADSVHDAAAQRLKFNPAPGGVSYAVKEMKLDKKTSNYSMVVEYVEYKDSPAESMLNKYYLRASITGNLALSPEEWSSNRYYLQAYVASHLERPGAMKSRLTLLKIERNPYASPTHDPSANTSDAFVPPSAESAESTDDCSGECGQTYRVSRPSPPISVKDEP